MKVMWDELEAYRPITTCSCAIPCSCGSLGYVKKYREHDYVIRFLKGLNEKFTQTKTQIMMVNPMPSIDQAFALIIQQEREINSSQSAIVTNNGTDDSTTLHLNAASDTNHPKSGNSYNSFKGKSNGYGGNKGQNRVCTLWRNQPHN